ncbi:MAG: hypothetical protein HUK02_08830, partial [Bacteroidaceae bacterium]|nr:hypothetical protein [Bacteroidaceae bacterium]
MTYICKHKLPILRKFCLFGVSLMLLNACSETKNLAEDETLYVGIGKLTYNEQSACDRKASDSTGVITALGNAYHVVNSVLAGDVDALELLKQNSATMSKQQRDSVKRVSKRDEQAFVAAQNEVKGALHHAPNNSLMGSSYHRFPLPLGLWLYNNNVYRDTKWGRWVLNNFAATPIYLTTVNPRLRTQVARNTLRNHGYFRGQVEYDVAPQKHPKKAKVNYSVQPGPLFHLDSIAYLPFPLAADTLVRRTMRKSLLHSGDPFTTSALDNERTRLSDLFRDHGFYFYEPSYVEFLADTLQRPLHVQLQVRQSPETPAQALHPYYMGNTRIQLYDYTATHLTDTLKRRTLTLAHSGSKGKSPLKLRSFRRFLTYKKGDLFNQTEQQTVQDNLRDMGVFSQLTSTYVPRDTTALCDTLDVLITGRLERPYDAEFKANVASKTNGLIGPGASFSMSKMNTFRGAETVSLEAHGSYEWQTGAQMKGQGQVINSYEYGVSLNLHFPRLTLLTLGRKLNRRATASTQYKIDAD